MLDWDCLDQLKRQGRTRLLIGRVPIWLDAPYEEEAIWLTVVLPEVASWVEGRRGSVLRMLQSSPELRDHLHLAGQQVFLKMEVPKRGCSPRCLRSAMERLCGVALRWRRWLLTPQAA